MKSPILLTVAACLLASGMASATITLSISNPATGALTNIADSAGSTAPGLAWGIVVDAQGNGFNSTFGPGAGFLLTTNLVGVSLAGSDDVFYFDSSRPTTVLPGAQGGPGCITQMASMTLPASLGVGQGDAFAIVWFDRGFGAGSTSTSETRWGFYTNPSFVLPPEGSNQPFSSLFIGPDPVRAVPTPEPAALILSLLGTLPLLRRRR